MPAGVTWSQYLTFSAAAMLSMFAGSQIVHQYYKPLQNLHEYINRELKSLPANVQSKIREELKEEGHIQGTKFMCEISYFNPQPFKLF